MESYKKHRNILVLSSFFNNFIGNKYYISGMAANNFNMMNSRAAIWEGTSKTAKLLKPGKDPILKQAAGDHHAASEWDMISQPIKFG